MTLEDVPGCAGEPVGGYYGGFVSAAAVLRSPEEIGKTA